ncbi:MAG: ATP-binding protein [Gemmatimonadota bacterium]|nr:ATP-binding protein [Gemmatimonadota bacterium]
MPAGLRLSIGAGHDEVARVHAAVAEFATAERLPADVRRSVQVVVDELLANIVLHGLAGRDGGEATIEITCGPHDLTITVSDNGAPFDPFRHAEPDTTLSVEARPTGGLGIHLVRRMVDEARYQRLGDRNVTILTKRLAKDTSHRPGGD